MGEVRRRYVVRLHPEVFDDLKELKKADPKARRKVDELLEALEGGPGIGEYPLLDEWEGCYTVHVGYDKYRVIWEPLEAELGFEDDEEVELVTMMVLRVGPKYDAHKRTIYDQGRRDA